MKKNGITALLATLAALAALSSCSKDTDVPGGDDPQVSIIKADIVQPSSEGETKTSLGDLTSGSYPVLWTENDDIAVSNKSASTYATYTTTADKTTSGEFKIKSGTVPEDPVYSYYPAGKVTSVSGSAYTVTIPATQNYVEGSFDNGAFPMYASAEKLSKGLTFNSLMSVLKLQLTGSKTVKKIVITSDTENLSGTAQVNVSDGTLSWTDGNKKVELDCGDGVALTSTAKTFHIVLPAAAAKNYYVSIVTDASTPYQGVVKNLTGKTFTKGAIKKMPAVDVTSQKPIYIEGSYMAEATYVGGNSQKWWAPVNCGYEPATTSPAYKGYPYGKLYQWGRKNGQGYGARDATYPSGSQITTYYTGTNGSEKSSYFYKGSETNVSYYADWIKSGDNSYWNGTSKGNFDPCPDGWRVPAFSEINALIGNKGAEKSKLTGGYDSGKGGFWLNGTQTPQKEEGLFLPFTGYRDWEEGVAGCDSYYGPYWSSTVYGGSYPYCMFYLDVENDGVYIPGDIRACGNAVRCIKE